MERKQFFVALLLCFFIGVNTYASEENPIIMEIIDEGEMANDPTKGPVNPFVIFQDDNILSLPAFNVDCTLQLVGASSNVVYSVLVPSGTTLVVLPTWLSGEYELQIIPTGSNYYFTGTISL